MSKMTNDDPIVICGFPSEQWETVQAIQNEAFIYVQYNGHRRNDPDDLQYLIDLIDREKLDGYWNPFMIENPRECVEIKNEDGIRAWVDGDRMYESDGVYHIRGNFLKYSHSFAIDTNHKQTIQLFKLAIKNNSERIWSDTEPDVLTSRETKMYSSSTSSEVVQETTKGSLEFSILRSDLWSLYQDKFSLVIRPWGEILLHSLKPVWVVYYPLAPKGAYYQVYRSTVRVPKDRDPWTVDNEAEIRDGYKTLDEALVAADETEVVISKSENTDKPRKTKVKAVRNKEIVFSYE